MSDTYTKLFSSITESTVWSEPAGTRLVWITMLAKANRHGEVFAAIPGLARLANVPIPECEAALLTFMSPDKWSRTPDNEGRRIEEISGGWRLLNFAKFDRMKSEIEAKEREAERKRKWDAENRKGRANAKYRHPSTPDVPPTNPDDPPTFPDAPPAVAVTTTKKNQKQKSSDDPSADGSAPTDGESPAVMFLPLNTGPEYPVTDAQRREFSGLYPAVDVMQELRGMRAWCISNPEKRKTRSGILRFVNKWLSKAQDDSRGSPSGNRTPSRKLSAVEQVEQAIADRDGHRIIEG